MDRERFEKQLAFLKEIDKLKNVVRRTRLLDDSRYENDAEHGWHLAIMAIVLAEYANSQRLDVSKVVRMALIHDLVEIDAGDTFLYDHDLQRQKRANESRAAERIFGLLPSDQAKAFSDLWEEFEARKTPEARFAASLDRFEPIIQNALTHGHAWQRHGISREQAEATNKHIKDGSKDIWEYVRKIYDECERQGFFAPE
jgi:putative hydrolase of HD superfamily